jgi:hypothetical protein
MKAKKVSMQSIHFNYPKTIFFKAAIKYVAIMLGALFILALFKAPVPWLVVFFIIFFLFLVVFAISPLLTTHVLTGARLLIRQGWYFRVTIPLKEIEDIDPLEQGRPGLSSSVFRYRLYVTSSDYNMVLIKLKESRRFVSILGKMVKEVVINLDEKDRFLREIMARVQSLQSKPTVLKPNLGT